MKKKKKLASCQKLGVKGGWVHLLFYLLQKKADKIRLDTPKISREISPWGKEGNFLRGFFCSLPFRLLWDFETGGNIIRRGEDGRYFFFLKKKGEMAAGKAVCASASASLLLLSGSRPKEALGGGGGRGRSDGNFSASSESFAWATEKRRGIYSPTFSSSSRHNNEQRKDGEIFLFCVTVRTTLFP